MPKNSQNEDRIRLNLELHPEVKDQLDLLQKTTKASSLTEVIRRALALYHFVVDRNREGEILFVEKADGSKEKVIIL